MEQTTWAFNVAIDESVEQNLRIKELLQLAQRYIDRCEYEAARVLLTRASASDAGKLELARFYLNTVVKLDMDVRVRWRQSEQLLINLECGESCYTAEACALLSQLYRQAKKPLSSLGYQLRGNRLKGDGTEDGVTKILAWLQKQPVAVLEEDARGAYLLGEELMCYVGKAVRQWERRLLHTAAKYGTGTYVGTAAQYLAEIYSAENPEIAIKYAKMANKAGNPLILTRE